jgi:hypothetical protein
MREAELGVERIRLLAAQWIASLRHRRLDGPPGRWRTDQCNQDWDTMTLLAIWSSLHSKEAVRVSLTQAKANGALKAYLAEQFVARLANVPAAMQLPAAAPMHI